MPPLPTDLVLNLSIQSGDYLGSMINSFLPLFHKTLKKALENYGIDNVQYFPVTLVDPNAQTEEDKHITSFFVANIIGRLDCVDLNKSKVNYWPSQRGYDLLSTVIDEQKTNGQKIFRIKDDPTLIIINEELKYYLVDQLDEVAGVDVIKTEDYSRW